MLGEHKKSFAPLMLGKPKQLWIKIIGPTILSSSAIPHPFLRWIHPRSSTLSHSTSRYSPSHVKCTSSWTLDRSSTSDRHCFRWIQKNKWRAGISRLCATSRCEPSRQGRQAYAHIPRSCPRFRGLSWHLSAGRADRQRQFGAEL